MFLESLDEFTGTYFVGVPDVTTLLLLIRLTGFMLVVNNFLADVRAMVGR